jgi:hypothetical protein
MMLASSTKHKEMAISKETQKKLETQSATQRVGRTKERMKTSKT